MKLTQNQLYNIKSNIYKGKAIFVNELNKTYFFKLNSGYNVGIDKKNLHEAKELDNKKILTKKIEKSNIKNSDILILHTGGTIASKVDYSTGAVSDKFTPEEILSLFPELKNYGTIDSKLISNMPSDNMNFNHYNDLIAQIIKYKDDVKGIIITHGTDTLHYTSAALSFALSQIKIPIVLVGSQRSSDRPSSDAAINLLNAAYFITKKVPGVYVCMHEDIKQENCLIFNGVNLKKLHSSRRDAFKQINQNPYAKINYKEKFYKEISKPLQKLNLSVGKFDPKLKIGFIYSRPNMPSKELEFYEKYDALILIGTGLGHFPITNSDKYTKEHENIYNALKKIAKKIPVIMTTQTVNGKINLNVYTPGRKIKELGILGHNLSLSTETAYIKIAYLISNYKDKVKELYNKNLVGELDDILDI